MIAKALRLLQEQLRQYIISTDMVEGAIDAPEYVVLGNIALSDLPDLSPPIRQRVVLSLVNIHEEAALKNRPFHDGLGSMVRYRNAPVFLNLYLLFSANYDDYENALIRLSQVIEFFQGKSTFTYNDAPVNELLGDEGVADLRLILSLFSMTFEQVNHLWGSLGGKQFPFVLYKLALVKVQADRTEAAGRVVEEIASTERIR